MVQIDYVLAAAIFLSAFVGTTIFVTDYASNLSAETEIASMRAYAISLLDLSDRQAFGTKISEQGIGTRAWRTYVSVTSPGEDSNEVTKFRFLDVGFPAATTDYNSVAVYSSPGYGNSIPFSRFADEVSWASPVSSGTNIFMVWFDDDSSFPDRSTGISGSDNLTQTVWRPEQVWVVQHNALQSLSAVSYSSAKEAYNFRIRLIEGNTTAFSFGQVPTPSQNIIVASKPVLYQRSNADIGLAQMVVEVWM